MGTDHAWRAGMARGRLYGNGIVAGDPGGGTNATLRVRHVVPHATVVVVLIAPGGGNHERFVYCYYNLWLQSFQCSSPTRITVLY